jgi:DNA invertase Pin-like site-specific DNA recombinase
MYLRLSIEDDVTVDESNSITNQRRLIQEYIDRHEEFHGMPVVEKCDDGYSGTNLNRPAMQELLEMVKDNRVQVIIVKDISRFARNYIDSGKYLEQIFPFMGVRFISVNDNYDSRDFVGGLADIDVQFKSLLYDFYSKDISEKVRTAYEARKSEGMYYSRCAPYGYVIDKSVKGRLVVDEPAAENVRRIFRYRIDGKSCGDIARIFNEEEIPVPSVYMKENHDGGEFFTKGAHPVWTRTTISSILRNETYAGIFVYGKYRTEVVGSRKPHLLPRNEWKRIENHHVPIVSPEDFKTVRENAKTKFFAENVSFRKEKALFTGIIACSQCGCNMDFCHSAKGRDTYRCSRKYAGGVHACKSHVFSEDVENAVKGQLSIYLSNLSDMEKVLERKNRKWQEKVSTAREHLAAMEETKRKLQSDLRDAYEAYARKISDRETYLSQRQMYDGMLAGLEEKLKLQREAVQALEEESRKDTAIGGLDVWETGISIEQLTREMVVALVEKIIVHDDRSLEIKWKFTNPQFSAS